MIKDALTTSFLRYAKPIGYPNGGKMVSLSEKAEHITRALGNAGDTMIQTLGERGGDLLGRLENTSRDTSQAISVKDERSERHSPLTSRGGRTRLWVTTRGASHDDRQGKRSSTHKSFVNSPRTKPRLEAGLSYRAGASPPLAPADFRFVPGNRASSAAGQALYRSPAPVKNFSP